MATSLLFSILQGQAEAESQQYVRFELWFKVNQTNSTETAAYGPRNHSIGLDGMGTDSVSRFCSAVVGGYPPSVFYRVRMLSAGYPQGPGKVSPLTHVTEIGES